MARMGRLLVGGSAQQGIEARLVGLDQVFAQTKLMLGGARTKRAIAAALYQAGEEIMADSKENYVPVDTGALRSTGTAHKPEISDEEITVVLGYGGPAAGFLGEDGAEREVGYALIQHEDLSLNHARPEHEGEGNRPGQAKYLSTPLRNRAPQVPDDIAKSMRRAMKAQEKRTAR